MAKVGTSLQVKNYTALYTSEIADTVTHVSSSTNQGRTETVLDFNSGEGVNARDFSSAFSWLISQGTVLYVWQPSFIQFPENSYNRNSDWMPLGGANGFCQGVIIEADTFNIPKVFQLQDSDTLQYHTLNEVGNGGIAFNRQSIKAFSCTTPFVAHLVRLTTDDGIPWRVWNINLVYQPFPESTNLWQTELTSLEGVGWQHVRMINLEYISIAPVTLSFSVDTGNGSIAPLPITLPSSGGTQTKLKLIPTYNKWKLIAFSVSSTGLVNLFAEGMEVWVRSWGSSGVYRKMKPFAGPSSSSAPV